MEHRVMIHPAGEVEHTLKPQLSAIAKSIYGKDTEDVIFRVKKVPKHTNRRKLFFQGNEGVVDLKVFPHITLSQKINIDEGQEHVLFERMERITALAPFTLTSSYVGDYGEDFTIFLAYEDNKNADNLKDFITAKFEEFFSQEKETRDILHTTLVYDDANAENFKKAWALINKESIIGKKLPVSSVWLWRGLTPYN